MKYSFKEKAAYIKWSDFEMFAFELAEAPSYMNVNIETVWPTPISYLHNSTPLHRMRQQPVAILQKPLPHKKTTEQLCGFQNLENKNQYRM